MSRIVVVNFLSLDGVMQSPLSADDDLDGGFTRGGWVEPYMDEIIGRVMSEATVTAAGMLLGRKTYQTFARVWSHASPEEPAVAAMNRMPKYVVSHTVTAADVEWENTVVLGADAPTRIRAIIEQPGADVVVFGSGNLIQLLAAEDLIDEYRLLTFPLVLGNGKRLFPDGTPPTNLTLAGTDISSTGVVIGRYLRPE